MYMSRLFGLYGELCAIYPWEVIVAVMTLTACLFNLPTPKKLPNCPGTGCPEQENYIGTDTVIMTFFRCIAILYSYHQFRNMNKLGSKYILFIAGLFTVFSSFVFTSTVLNVMKIDLVDLKDAIFFFLLLIDSSKAVTLAQFALTASNQDDISKKISRGMSILGPTITLDSIVEVLVIGIGTLSGVHRLEMLSYYACLSVLVNYVIFMTFYPACLSLILELSKVPITQGRCNAISHVLEENQKSNPAVQRVKLIMSLGLTIVHVYSYWCFVDENVQNKSNNTTSANSGNTLQSYSFYNYIMKQFTISADHVVILILLMTLFIKFTFFGTRNQFSEELCLKPLPQKTLETCSLITQESPKTMENVEVQTETYQDVISISTAQSSEAISPSKSRRSLEECLQIYRNEGATSLTDEEIVLLIDTKHIACYDLEKALKNPVRGVEIRRRIIENISNCAPAFRKLPYLNYDFSRANSCCENVVGYVPVPLGLAGPLRLDDELYFIPMATTEGCLVASTNRGCRAVEKSGVISRIEGKGIAVTSFAEFPSITDAGDVKIWIQEPNNFSVIKECFNSSNKSIKLLKVIPRLCGPYLYLRFIVDSGDEVNMLALTKYTGKALKSIQSTFPKMKIVSVNSNDKKHSAANWIEGNGRSVVCECIIPAEIVSSVLKTTTHRLVELNLTKNHYGSSIAGSIGGNNAQASNIVTAIYIATGQDTAQNVGSSNCMTIMKPHGEHGQDLYVSCTMPSIVVGTAGGGTVLPAQSSCLELLGIRGHSKNTPGENADQLARIVCAAVLAGELSLMAALDTGDLVRSHLRYNRSYSETESRRQISMDKTS